MKTGKKLVTDYFRPFTKNDYYGFSGAEPFENGDPPLIGEIPINPKTISGEYPELDPVALIILDKNGIEIVTVPKDIRDTSPVFGFSDPDLERNRALLNGLSIPLNLRLIELIFERY